MENHNGQPRLFISYAQEDAGFVVWLSESLKAFGHNIRLARAEILGGVHPVDAIHDALDKADIMLVVITPESMRSRFVNSEWAYFYCECGKTLIPIALRPLEPPERLNFMLAALQHVDFYSQEHNIALSILHHTLSDLYAREGAENAGVRVEPVPRSYGPQNHWGQKEELSVTQAGLLRAHQDFPVGDFSAWLWEAHSVVRIMNTWTHIFVKYTQLLVKAVSRGITLQILLLDPSSPVAQQRSRDLHVGNGHSAHDADEVPRNIRASIRQIATLCPELECGSGQFELRLYQVLPSFSLHLVDYRALLGFFPPATRTTNFPLLEIQVDAPFGARIVAEFEQIWASATPIDLSAQFPERVLFANQQLAEPLSDRELEILSLINTGLSNQEIADKLVVTMSTVKKHINNLYSKLGIGNRTHAVLRAQELDLV